jgi:hypothetical protein
MIEPPRPRERTRYKKPRALNVVSLILLLILMVAVYFGYCVWPVINLRLRAKSEMQDFMPQLYRFNLALGNAPPKVMSPQIIEMKKEVIKKLREAGIKDPKLDVVVFRSKAMIALEAHFKATAYFEAINKSHVFDMAPRAETDATRVDW